MLDNSNINPNWFRLGEVMEELAYIQQLDDPDLRDHAAALEEKIQKCRDLKDKMENQSTLIKRQFLALLSERNLYVSKLQQIYEIGHNLSWEPQILRKIKQYIDSTKIRLRDKLKPQGQ